MAEKANFDFIYNPIKEKMHEIISYINYTTYIEKLVPVDVDGRFIVLETPTEVFAKYISGTLADKMREAIIKADVKSREATVLHSTLLRKKHTPRRPI